MNEEPWNVFFSNCSASSSSSSLAIEDEQMNHFKVFPKGLFEKNLILPNLSSILWPSPLVAKLPSGRKLFNKSRSSLPSAFQPIFSTNQRKLTNYLIKLFADKMYENNLGDRFMLYGGTLLGSFRHHDFIPWDDDADLLIDGSIQHIVRKLFTNNNNTNLQYIEGDIDKLCTKILPEENDTEIDYEQSRKTSKYPWGWPYIDLFFYLSNLTHIYVIRDQIWFPKSIIFPLYYRPLNNNWYPTPKDTLAFLIYQGFYGNDCETGYSHVYQKAYDQISILCKDLNEKYTFVEHRISNRNRINIIHTLLKKKSYEKYSNKIIWGKENLVIQTKHSKKVVIHTIELPMPYHNTQVETYGLSYRI
ncbi:unnamed protein product [Heterobilharzia americana]|nr:unnamed protein product [Heterobilharzia americana]CAH8581651.1 unnamed protein product [Heterobilharzia americana]